jgi:CBS domain-containing protein
MKVRDVMTPKVISIGADESVLKAARLPVLDKEGELVGIVTEGDFLRRGELDYPKTNIVRVGLNYQFH